MAIFIRLAQPGDRIGPGLPINFSTSFPGPLTQQSFWVVSAFVPPQPPALSMNWDLNATQFVQEFTLGVGHVPAFFANGQAGFSTDLQVQVSVNLVVDGLSVDVGQTPATYDAQSGLGIQAQMNQQGQGPGGFTETDRAQLQAVANSTVLDQLVNTFVLTPLTSGPTQGPVAATLTNPVFAVIVRIANIPPELKFGTPDEAYWFHDLAVVRIFRGTDIWLRVPVHTPSKIIPLPATEAIIAAVSDVVTRNWLTNLTLEVDFAPGATGEVFLQHVP